MSALLNRMSFLVVKDREREHAKILRQQPGSGVIEAAIRQNVTMYYIISAWLALLPFC